MAFAPGAPGAAECRLRGVTLQNTSSGEHKFKLTALVVTPVAFKVKSGIGDVANFVDCSSKQVYAHVASLHDTDTQPRQETQPR